VWQQVLLEGSSDQSLLRDGEGSSQTAEASVNIPEWESNWMDGFSDTYTESGSLDTASGQVSSAISVYSVGSFGMWSPWRGFPNSANV
jgi:hypothetical protein